MTSLNPTVPAPAGPPAGGRATSRNRVAAALLCTGALLAAAALSLHVRGGAENVAFVRRIEAESGQWLAAHVLMAVGGCLLAVALPTLLRLVPGRGRLPTAIGVTLASIGAAATALGDFAHGSLAYVLIDHTDAQQSLEIQAELFAQPVIAAVSMLGLLLPLGMLVLGAGLLRSRAAPPLAAALLLLSPVAIQAGFSVTALPMLPMVLPLAGGLAWVSYCLLQADRT